MTSIIERKEIKDWLACLKNSFKVIDIRKSALPAKQYFFLPREKIFDFDTRKNRLNSPPFKEKLLIFGLNLADLKAMVQLDEIMTKPQPDFFYWQRRKESTLVGLTEESMEMPLGGDLVLEKINNRQYQTHVFSEKGKKIIKGGFFKKISRLQNKKYPAKNSPLKEMLLDSELLAEAVAWSQNHQIWDELAKKCLGCGICTYVCPICHCFSIEDQLNLEGTQSTRCRFWDACTLPRFAQVAGGHNFHRTLKERYYNWFYHKFVRAYKEYGRAQCVDCGRCQKYCPAGIDIEKVLLRIVSDYQKSQTIKGVP